MYCNFSIIRQPTFLLFGSRFTDESRKDSSNDYDGGTVSDQEETLYKVVITYTIFIFVFTVLPIFMVVLIGVSNCISFTASSRKWHPAQSLAIRLDRRHNISTVVLLALMLVHFTRKMSEEVDVGNGNESDENEVSDATLLVSGTMFNNYTNIHAQSSQSSMHLPISLINCFVSLCNCYACVR